MFKRGDVWYTTISIPGHRRRKVSLGTSLESVARRVDAWAEDVAQRLDRLQVLRAVYLDHLKLTEAFSLGEQGAAELLATRAEEDADVVVTQAILDAWQQWVTTKGNATSTATVYRRQVETLYPHGLKTSMLTPSHIMDRLDALTASETTKGRYRAAMGSLCSYLTRKRVVPANPMASVAGYQQSKARTLYYAPADAERLLASLDGEQRAIETVMYACGWEWSACRNALVEDFDLAHLTAFARGTKSATRARLTVFTEPHLLDYVRPVLASKLPKARVFTRLGLERALKRHHAACRALDLPETTLHDWRHTYAVKELKKGVSPQAVAQMLGHSTAQLVITRYGLMTSTPEEIRERAKAQQCSQSVPISAVAGPTR